MDTQKIKEEKTALQNKIRQLVSEFQSKTGVRVEEVNVDVWGDKIRSDLRVRAVTVTLERL